MAKAEFGSLKFMIERRLDRQKAELAKTELQLAALQSLEDERQLPLVPSAPGLPEKGKR